MNNVISIVKESNGKEISTFKCKIIRYIVCSVTLAVYSHNTEYIMFIYRAKGLEWCDFTLHFCKWWLQCLSHDNLLSLSVCVCVCVCVCVVFFWTYNWSRQKSSVIADSSHWKLIQAIKKHSIFVFPFMWDGFWGSKLYLALWSLRFAPFSFFL